jgi:DNA polymerase-3 subunit delta
VKISPSRADAFSANPEAGIRAILVYGPDLGLVRERAERLCRSVLAELNDPFRMTHLSAASLRDEPSRLADEAAQIALVGGRRVIRLRDAGDGIVEALRTLLDDSRGDALVVAEAGDLPARSKLRLLFEDADNAASLPCYADSEETIAHVVRETLHQAGLSVTGDALDYLTEQLGADRLVTRSELEKLVLFVGRNHAQVRLEDAEACIGDSAAHSLDDGVFAAAEGDAAAVERALGRAFAAGESPVSALRAAQRHFQRLHLAAGQIARGQPDEHVVDGLKPKLFWKMRSRFLLQLKLWSASRLGLALERLTATEIACKSTGTSDQAVAVRCFLELAFAAARRRRSA